MPSQQESANWEAPLAARYFDGHSSRPRQVGLSVRDGLAVLSGEVERSCALSELRVSERSAHAPRKVTFPDGAYLEMADAAAFQALLHSTGQRDSWVVRLQQSWRGALLAAATTVVALALGYQFGLPLAAGWLAKALPVKIERQLGQGVLDVLDQRVFLPSALPPARRQALSATFAALHPPRKDLPPYRIVFRKSKIGPNAFALPSGDIILTDEMVELLADEQAVMGVLAHELGHLHERHLSRRIIQSSAIAATAALLFGDVSSVVVALPTVMLDMKYSRDAEREADDYAIAMLKANGIGLEHLVRAFTRFASLDKGNVPYVSSHPANAERIARIKNMEGTGAGRQP